MTPVVEHYLLWVLPLKRGYQYLHAALVSSGAKTVSTTDNAASQFAKYQRLVKERMKKG